MEGVEVPISDRVQRHFILPSVAIATLLTSHLQKVRPITCVAVLIRVPLKHEIHRNWFVLGPLIRNVWFFSCLLLRFFL